MKQSRSKRRTWTLRVIVTLLVVFTLYLCFGLWGVPAILESQIPKRGSEITGRDVRLDRATFNPLTLEVRLFDLTVAGQGEEDDLLSLGRMAANAQITSIWPGRIDVKAFELSDGRLNVRREQDGSFNFDDVLQNIENATEDAPAEEDAEPTAARIRTMQIDNFALDFTDVSLATPYSETVVLERFAGRDIGTVKADEMAEDGTERLYHWDFDGNVRMESGAVLELSGGATEIDPWAFQARAVLRDFPVASVQPYVDDSLMAQIAGVFGFDFTTEIDLADSGSPSIIARGDLNLDTLNVEDESQHYLSAERFGISGLEVDVGEQTLRIAEVLWQKPVFSLGIAESGELRLPELVVDEQSVAEEEGGSSSFYLDATVDSVAVREGVFEFSDYSLEEDFITSIQNIEFALTDLNARLASELVELSARSELAMDFLAGQLSITGSVESLEQGGSVEVRLQSLDLAVLQPYLQQSLNAVLQEGKATGILKAELGGESGLTASGDLNVVDLLLFLEGEEQELARISDIAVAGFSYSDEGVVINSIAVTDPSFRIVKDQNGLNVSRVVREVEEDEPEVAEPETVAQEAIEEDAFPPISLQRFSIEGGSVEFVDTTLVSPSAAQLTELAFMLTDASTATEEPADFQFATTVESGGKIGGSGQVRLLSPTELANLTLEIDQFNVPSVSAYAETYLAHQIASGRFTISSDFELRESQLNGTNSFRIANLELGERVESEDALNLPIGFAISLLKDSSGNISFDNLTVSGDISEPGVGIGGLIGQALGNLIVRAATSPFKFLAGIVGGREDLNTIQFEPISVELSAEANDKLDSVARILQERPALKLEITSTPDFEAERELLKGLYLEHRLANPDFQPTSGMDLLQSYDQEAYRAGLEAAYREAQMQEQAQARSQPSEASENEESPADTPEVEEERKGGFISFIARVLGISRDADEPEEVGDESQNRDVEVAEAGSDDQVEPLPSNEEMFATLLEKLPDDVVERSWSVDIGRARVQAFSQELQNRHEIDSARIATPETPPADDQQGSGQLQLNLRG